MDSINPQSVDPERPEHYSNTCLSDVHDIHVFLIGYQVARPGTAKLCSMLYDRYVAGTRYKCKTYYGGPNAQPTSERLHIPDIMARRRQGLNLICIVDDEVLTEAQWAIIRKEHHG